MKEHFILRPSAFFNSDERTQMTRDK